MAEITASVRNDARHSIRAVALELAVVTSVFLLYRSGRVITNDAADQALANAHRIISLERGLGIFTEPDVQRWVLASHQLVEFLNRYYVVVHFPVTVAFLVWAYIWHLSAYRRIRTWFVVVTLLALAIHVGFPLAPPRMTGQFVDTLHVFGPRIYPTDTTQSVANQFAAMPSLHFGWALMVAVGVVAIRRRRSSLLVFVHPFVTLTAIVATGNHYWFDSIVAGTLVAVSGSILLLVWRRGEAAGTGATELAAIDDAAHAAAVVDAVAHPTGRTPCARRSGPLVEHADVRTPSSRPPCARARASRPD